MKKIIGILHLVLVVLLLVSCNNKEKSIKEEYQNVDEKSFIPSHNQYSIHVDACDMKIELTTHDKESIDVKLYYKQESDRDKINFDFTNQKLAITGAVTPACLTKREASTVLFLSVPRESGDVSINLSNLQTHASFEDVKYQSFNFIQLNGTLEVDKGEFKTMTTSVVNGELNYKNVRGDIIRTIMNNGDIELEDLIINERLQVDTTNGDITVKNVKYEGDPEVRTRLSAVTVNGQIELREVYMDQIELHTTNGDIRFTNRDKDFYVEEISYNLSSGIAEFDINGHINE